jgi:hypothetical protein
LLNILFCCASKFKEITILTRRTRVPRRNTSHLIAYSSLHFTNTSQENCETTTSYLSVYPEFRSHLVINVLCLATVSLTRSSHPADVDAPWTTQ